MNEIMNRFCINGQTCVITGGAGLLGRKHSEAVLAGGGIPCLLDVSKDALDQSKALLLGKYPEGVVETFCVNITDRQALKGCAKRIIDKYKRIDILINNAANNPKMEEASKNIGNIRFDNFPMEIWLDDIAVGLTGAFICSQVFGSVMEQQGKGVILNISSDLGIIAPDQRIYRRDGLQDDKQTVKPVTYSVIKHGLLGLTKYLATYWAEKGIRVNAVCPAGVENGQDPDFVAKLTSLVPMGRMAKSDEYQCTILYMISDASSYMTGSTVIIDGGRTCW